MSVDRKSNHYTSAKNYTDLDGNTRSFDFIDHDVKTSIAKTAILTEEEKASLKDTVKTDKEKAIDKLLSLPASACPEVFHQFTLRGDIEKVEWNEKMIRDAGIDYMKLYSILTLVENKLDKSRN